MNRCTRWGCWQGDLNPHNGKCEPMPPLQTVPALVPTEVQSPCPDVGTFLRRLGLLHMDAKKLDWGNEQLARINASALCSLIATEISEG